jgi:hypothetical protein
MPEAKPQASPRTGWFKEFGKALEPSVAVTSALALVVGFIGGLVAQGLLELIYLFTNVFFRYSQAKPVDCRGRDLAPEVPFCFLAAVPFLLEWQSKVQAAQALLSVPWLTPLVNWPRAGVPVLLAMA